MIVPECTGECCRIFPISGMTRQQIKEKTAVDCISTPEGLAILAFMIPTGLLGVSNDPLFTCAHWHPETKHCLVYESRPKLCREYPYEGGYCKHCQRAPETFPVHLL